MASEGEKRSEAVQVGIKNVKNNKRSFVQVGHVVIIIREGITDKLTDECFFFVLICVNVQAGQSKGKRTGSTQVMVGR